MPKIFKYKKLLTSLLLIFACIFFIKSCNKKKNTEFPKISLGYYTGELKINKKIFPLLIFNSQNISTLALINPGISPRKIELSNFQLELDGKSYDLVGSKVDKKYQGEVLLNKKEVGTWNLKKIKPKLDVSEKFEDLNQSIKKYYLLRTEAKSLNQENSDLAARIETYKGAIPKEEKLRIIALNEIEDLNYSLDEKKAERRKIAKIIKDNVTNLEQLQRITTLGRVVDLARRTTKREDRWYLANWGEGELDESQQQLADSLGLDTTKLGEKLKLAEEYINLKNSISLEARKIEELRNAKVNQKIEQEVHPQMQQQKPKEQKSFWNKLGDAFGL